MPKKTRATLDWGVEDRGGTEASGVPYHWTVCRDKYQDGPFPTAKRQAESYNLWEDKSRYKQLTAFRKVFDQKALKEFQLPEGMTEPKFHLCEKVWVVVPHMYETFAVKGIISGARWCPPLKKWLYGVSWYARDKEVQKGDKRNQYHVEDRYFLEEYLWKFEDKAKAREILIATIAKVLTWVADFEDRLHKLRPGDLKIGESLK